MAKVRKTRTARTLAGVSAIALGLTGVLAASGAAFAAQGTNGTPPANTEPGTTGSLTIHKFLGPVGAPGNGLGTYVPPSGTVPLGGVEFTVQQLGITVQGDTDLECEVIDLRDSSQNLDWNKLQGAAPAAIADVPGVGTAVGDLCLPTGGVTYTLTTNTTDPGFGTVTQQTMPLSAYYVYESDASGAVNAAGESITVASKAVPFFVTVPLPTVATDGTPVGTGGTGQNWVYDVNVYPKNQDVNEPTKTVDEELSDLTIGEQLTWTIQVPIPDLSDPITVAKVYDQLDENLKFVSTTSVKVDGTPVTDDELVQATLPAADDTGSIAWDFGTDDGLALMNAHKGKVIEIVFVTEVTAVPEEGIIDNPGGTVGNGYGSIFNTTTTPGGPTPGKAAGSLVITKVDAADENKTLAGAVFEVYAKVGACEAAASDYDESALVAKGTSGADGIVLWGSPDGSSPLALPIAVWQGTEDDPRPADLEKDYCVYETQAPSGYTAVAVANPITITPGTSEARTYDLEVENTRNQGPTLPLTGAAGTALLIAGGLGLVAIAVGASMVIRNRQKQDA